MSCLAKQNMFVGWNSFFTYKRLWSLQFFLSFTFFFFPSFLVWTMAVLLQTVTDGVWYLLALGGLGISDGRWNSVLNRKLLRDHPVVSGVRILFLSCSYLMGDAFHTATSWDFFPYFILQKARTLWPSVTSLLIWTSHKCTLFCVNTRLLDWIQS